MKCIGQNLNQVDDLADKENILDRCGSNFIPCEENQSIDRFHLINEINEDDIFVGKLLGHGCFCDVYEVSVSEYEQEKNPIADMYAIKMLSPRIFRDPEQARIGASDLTRETLLLTRLCHKNIITLYGAARSQLSEDEPPFVKEIYSLIMERLVSTVDSQLSIWGKKDKMEDGQLKPFQNQVTFPRRIAVAFQVAQALAHLHENSIIYRDLKPENIGFDTNQIVKLFDFGLAKEINCLGKDRCHTQMAGSFRYMAPEVALGTNYNTKADVYSFGIFLWEIFFLSQPFNTYNDHIPFLQDVAFDKKRPPLHRDLNPYWQILIKRCWEHDEEERPNFRFIVNAIQTEETENQENIDKILNPLDVSSTMKKITPNLNGGSINSMLRSLSLCGLSTMFEQ